MAKTKSTLRRKNMLMDQRKLDAAKVALGAPSERAAVDAALDFVVFRQELHGSNATARTSRTSASISRRSSTSPGECE